VQNITLISQFEADASTHKYVRYFRDRMVFYRNSYGIDRFV